MAGNAWDIIVHAVITGVKWIIHLWKQSSTELLLGASFFTQLVLSLLAGSRWSPAGHPCHSALIKVKQTAVWLAYVVADYLATTAVGNLSIGSASGERQLVAFWAPFFLLHLGGPDNITAYEFEDNQLSKRAVLELVMRVSGVVFIVYSSVSVSWVLILAAWLMLFVCVTKYVERILALHRANLRNIRKSIKLNKEELNQNGGHLRNLMLELKDTSLVTKAHFFFHVVCKPALVDSLREEGDLDPAVEDEARKALSSILEPDKLVELMEMELSLMYEFLYTKASVIYTWHGYGVRLLAPLAAFGALVAVELSNQQDGGRRHKQSDVFITRVLLSASFILETVSLLRALGSSWTGFLLCTRKPPAWIRHQFFCNGRWDSFRRWLASIRLLAEDKVDHHRRWAGNIRMLNLLERVVVTCGRRGEEQDEELFWADSKEGPIDPDARQELSRKVRHKVRDFRDELKQTARKGDNNRPVRLANSGIIATWGQKTLEDYDKLKDQRDTLGKELQVGILTWHVGTTMFLNISDKAKNASDERAERQVKAVRTLSDYMMHLLVERPHMLPDLINRYLLEDFRRDLVKIWGDGDKVGDTTSTSGKERLAKILNQYDKLDTIGRFLCNGIKLGKTLIKMDKEEFSKKGKKKEKGIVEVILDVWVDMLFYASYRCSKESHAKQLAYGGEFTTIVWLLAEHASLFLVRKDKNGNDPETNNNSEQNRDSGDQSTSVFENLKTASASNEGVQASGEDKDQSANHYRSYSWNSGGEVMIQLHPVGFSSGAYDLHAHDYFHQNYL